MATTVRGRVRRNRRTLRVRRRIRRVNQRRRSRVVHGNVNCFRINATAVLNLDHRIEIADGCCRTGNNAGQAVESQTCRKRIGENRVTQVGLSTRARRRIRSNGSALGVRDRIMIVRQPCRSRVVHRDRYQRAVCSTRIAHFDARREITQCRRRTRNRTRDTVQRKTRRQCTRNNGIDQVRMATTV